MEAGTSIDGGGAAFCMLSEGPGGLGLVLIKYKVGWVAVSEDCTSIEMIR